jgi:hypothetical protein
VTRTGRTFARAERIAIALLIAGLGAMALPAAPGRTWTAGLVAVAAAVAVVRRREAPGNPDGAALLPGPALRHPTEGSFLAGASPTHSPAAPRAPPLPA